MYDNCMYKPSCGSYSGVDTPPNSGPRHRQQQTWWRQLMAAPIQHYLMQPATHWAVPRHRSNREVNRHGPRKLPTSGYDTTRSPADLPSPFSRHQPLCKWTSQTVTVMGQTSQNLQIHCLWLPEILGNTEKLIFIKRKMHISVWFKDKGNLQNQWLKSIYMLEAGEMYQEQWEWTWAVWGLDGAKNLSY